MSKYTNGKLKDKVDLILRLNDEGKSVPEIARLLDVSEPAIRYKMKSIGIESNKCFKQVSGDDPLIFAELYSIYNNPHIVSVLTGNSVKNISKSLEAQGFTLDYNSIKDHSSKDNRFYVYSHSDAEGIIKYIGSGSGLRAISKNGRSEEHLRVFNSLVVKILHFGLSKQEAYEIEENLIREYKSEYLLNKDSKVNKVKYIQFEEMNRFFYYDETSPTFLRWKVDRRNYSHCIVNAGDVAGVFDSSGYAIVTLMGRRYRVHRIVYCLMNGEDLPTNLIVDHVDRSRANNSIDNLRLATHHQNILNRDNQNQTGVTGVTLSRNGYKVNWSNGIYTESKDFTPSIFYPDLPPEEAKQKAFEDAVAYRKQMEDLYYNKPE